MTGFGFPHNKRSKENIAAMLDGKTAGLNLPQVARRVKQETNNFFRVVFLQIEHVIVWKFDVYLVYKTEIIFCACLCVWGTRPCGIG